MAPAMSTDAHAVPHENSNYVARRAKLISIIHMKPMYLA
jgi:hypothetical protein